MNKRDALRLQRGQRIVWGDSMWSAQVSYWQRGTVIKVTEAGGILVRRDGGDALTWIPYHHVHQGAYAGEERPRRPRRPRPAEPARPDPPKQQELDLTFKKTQR